LLSRSDDNNNVEAVIFGPTRRQHTYRGTAAAGKTENNPSKNIQKKSQPLPVPFWPRTLAPFPKNVPFHA
jgi:hypothetical protein